MKILLYSANFAPEPTGIGKYSGEMAAWLASKGHQVRVVCAPPYYPAWRVAAGYGSATYRREVWQGVDVWRSPLWVPAKPGGLARVLHLVSFAAASFPVVLWQARWRPELVMTVAPALVCAPGGWLVARLSGARCWLHLQDFELDVAFQLGLLKGAFARHAMLAAERWLMRRFDRVSSISVRMVERLKLKGVSAANVRRLPNWVDLTILRPLERPSDYRALLGIEACATVALFSGTLGSKQRVTLIPEVARLLARRSDIVFVVCGDGVMKAELERASAGLPNMRLLPLQPVDRLPELLGLADIHLLTQTPDAEDLVLPSKLSGMLASGRAVVATCHAGTEIADVVNRCGLVVPPENVQAFAVAVVQLADDAPRRHELGAAGRRYAEQTMSMERVLSAWEHDAETLVSRSQQDLNQKQWP